MESIDTGGVRFGVLGPLSVEIAGQPVDVPGLLPRRLLTALIIHAGRSCTVETLIDLVWADQVPPTAVKTLQAYVARLRALLGPDIIATDARGYRLDASPRSIDAVVFTELVEQAGRCLADG